MNLFVRVLIWLAPVLSALCLWPAQAAGQTSPAGPQRTERIEAELVPMSAWATPGSTAVVAVKQTIQPDWHTYWRNPGDSGGATTLTWTLPQGVRAGDIVWPVPERQRIAGLMNYGYSGVVYLPVPVEIPASARSGTTLTLAVKALFLVCSAEMCVPDELTLRLDLPVREGAAPLDPRHGAAITAVLESAPRPAGLEARMALDNGVLVLSAAGGPLAGRDPGASYFFPFEGGIIDHPAAQTGVWGPQGLTLRLLPGGETRAAGLSGPIEGVLVTAHGAWEIKAEQGAAPAGTSGSGELAAAADGASAEPAVGAGAGTSLAVFAQAVLFAVLGGLILNLMPCVFPILAMKAASLAASAHDVRHARRDGLAFLAGVMTTFVLLAGVLLVLRAAGEAVGWGFQLQSPPVMAGLALLMLAVALNLSGVFHVGAGLQGVGSGPLARLPGGLGAFFTGSLAVIVAAPCTAPFMAFALGAALVMPWPMALVVFLGLGLGLALPFVAVSLTPGLLARLPRPGPWMERLKGLLAFPMYATALWLAWVFGRQTSPEALGLLFIAGLLLALGVWLVGCGQAERGFGRRGVFHLTAGVAALLLAGAALILAARLPVPAAGPAASVQGAGPVSAPWSPAAVKAALAEGRPVLVNFTADWCVTCKINERTSLTSAGVKAAMERTHAVYLVGDWTRRDDAITAELQRHGRSGVPLYLLYSPGSAEPRILPQLLTEGVVVEALMKPSPVGRGLERPGA
ncbi:protein-disulfide reductase DsbD [Brevundimonas sp.]|uniref:protein-disulfide reductase DsbD family protein n=1 Tax=Brevundimonas sp. TaxID=1871086 RepID=UPI00273165A2|nr:protein-disulfide reductase DsbD domain-containing protein [Brevundimonas sp.]MDP1912412.1 protein-disulfide reductase DsbD family protein [Brevundimonas sp.]